VLMAEAQWDGNRKALAFRTSRAAEGWKTR